MASEDSVSLLFPKGDCVHVGPSFSPSFRLPFPFSCDLFSPPCSRPPRLNSPSSVRPREALGFTFWRRSELASVPDTPLISQRVGAFSSPISPSFPSPTTLGCLHCSDRLASRVPCYLLRSLKWGDPFLCRSGPRPLISFFLYNPPRKVGRVARPRVPPHSLDPLVLSLYGVSTLGGLRVVPAFLCPPS